MEHRAFQEMAQALSTALNHLSDAAAELADNSVPALGLPEENLRASPPGAPQKPAGSVDQEIPLSDIGESRLWVGALLSRSAAPVAEGAPLVANALAPIRSVPVD